MRRALNRPFFWIMLGVVIWALTFGWGWQTQRILIDQNRKDAHRASVQTCISVNELRRTLFTASLDLGVNRAVAARFRPTKNCEALP